MSSALEKIRQVYGKLPQQDRQNMTRYEQIMNALAYYKVYLIQRHDNTTEPIAFIIGRLGPRDTIIQIDFATLPEYRGRHVAEKMIRDLIDTNKYKYIFWITSIENELGITLMRRLGFKLVTDTTEKIRELLGVELAENEKLYLYKV